MSIEQDITAIRASLETLVQHITTTAVNQPGANPMAGASPSTPQAVTPSPTPVMAGPVNGMPGGPVSAAPTTPSMVQPVQQQAPSVSLPTNAQELMTYLTDAFNTMGPRANEIQTVLTNHGCSNIGAIPANLYAAIVNDVEALKGGA